MRILKNIFSQMHRWVFWAVISLIFWAWIFSLLTDTAPARKVTLYAMVDRCEDKALALKLEETKPEGIRMIKVHPFSYALFDDGDLDRADLFILPLSQVPEDAGERFCSLDGETLELGEREIYRVDGRACGVKIYDAATGTGAAASFLSYDPGEDYYLFFNAASLHLGSGDGAALRVAEALLKLS